MTSFFISKASSPPGSAPPSPLRSVTRSSTPPLNTAPPSVVVPPAMSPLVPRDVTIPQPVLPIIRDVYLPCPRVREITSLSTATLYRYMGLGLFPRPHKLGPNRVGWLASSVLDWLSSRTGA